MVTVLRPSLSGATKSWPSPLLSLTSRVTDRFAVGARLARIVKTVLAPSLTSEPPVTVMMGTPHQGSLTSILTFCDNDNFLGKQLNLLFLR